jgi:hypothetical protein
MYHCSTVVSNLVAQPTLRCTRLVLRIAKAAGYSSPSTVPVLEWNEEMWTHSTIPLILTTLLALSGLFKEVLPPLQDLVTLSNWMTGSFSSLPAPPSTAPWQ